MNYLMILITIVAIILIVIISKKLWDKWNGNSIVIFDMPQDSRILEKIKNDKYMLSQEEKGLSFTTSFWIYIDGWNHKYGQEKIIMNKGGFKVFLSGINNDITVEMPTYNNNNSEFITYRNVPLQKWLNVVIVLENRYLDLWINGKLYHARYLKNLPLLDESLDLLICPNDGFHGWISRFHHWDHPITKNHIKYVFNQGPINKNPFIKLWNYLLSIKPKVKFDVKFDVAVDIENEKEKEE